MTRRRAPRSDGEARRLAQREFDRPVAVEAGAGTGKTTVLVARVLSWCLAPGWSAAIRELERESSPTEPTAAADPERVAARLLDGVLAITFTEAAAAEMAERIAGGLAIVAAGRADELTGFEPSLLQPRPTAAELMERATAMIGALDHLAVRTIHSYCLHLLASHPMAAGLSPALRVDADGTVVEEIVREVVEEAVKEAYDGNGEAPLARLSLSLVGPRGVGETLSELVRLGLGSEALRRDPLAPEHRRAIRERLHAALTTLDQQIGPFRSLGARLNGRKIADATTRSLAVIEAAPGTPDLHHLARLLAALRLEWDGLRKHLESWAAGDFNKTEAKAIGPHAGRLRAAAEAVGDTLERFWLLDPERLDHGRRALLPLLARVEDELRARGYATYPALLREAWRLLSSRPRVARRERRRIRQLLVDEFQDTDRLQCELVRLLGLTGPPEERPGLFVVGDPKQSIYGWRDADLDSYETFVGDLVEAGGVAVPLRRSFRSVPAVLAEVDRAIAPLMIEARGLQPEYSSLEVCDALASAEGFRGDDRVAVEYWVSWEDAGAETSAARAVALEADAVAGDIRRLHERSGVEWRDFALLLRSTTQLESYLEAFRRHGVPFLVGRDKHYYRRREVIDAAATVRAILDPLDHLALVTFLRSPAVGVPDAALLPLWLRGFPALVTELRGGEDLAVERARAVVREAAAAMPTDIPGLPEIEGWEASLAAALQGLAGLRHAYDTLPADRFVERLRRQLLLDVTEAGRYLGRYRLANLDRFFRSLERSLEQHDGDVQAVLRAIRRSVAAAREEEGALPEGAGEDAVQVLTIHGAKGLEFRQVYLAQLHVPPRRDHPEATAVDSRWLPGREAEYVLFGCPTPGFLDIRRRRRAVAQAERVRTLYVAMTRARERLVMIGKWPADPSRLDRRMRDSYVDLLRHRREQPASLVELLDRCRRRRRAFADAGGVRWRFPSLDRPAASSHPASRRRSGLPSVKRLREEAERLARQRRAAAERMSRPYARTASMEAQHRFDRLQIDEAGAGELPDPRDVAMAVGDAFHRMLESWRPGADPAAEFDRLWGAACGWLASLVAPDARAAAQARLEELQRRFRGGALCRRFLDVADQIIARELPVLLPPGDSKEAPVGFVSGAIDLLYRDSGSGLPVVVDYKTDRLTDESRIRERAIAYQAQQRVYARAVQESLALDRPPTCELWFVWPDRLWEYSPDTP